jgi:hypothetical protein
MLVVLGVGILAAGLAGAGGTAQAAPGDVATPGSNGAGAVIVLPSVPGTVGSGAILVMPTMATGAVVVPVQPQPVSGSGPSITRYLLVIPGPNPAQNTSVSLGQQLSSALGGSGPVTVYPVPGPR